MKKYILSFSALVVALLLTQEVKAQRPSVVLERQIIEQGLTTVDNYISQIALGDEEVYYSFLELFDSEEVMVYNDLFGLYSSKELPVKEYANSLLNEIKNTKVQISNIKKDSIWNEDGVWKLLISLDKDIAYSNKCGIFFSSQDFFGKSYRIDLIMSYDENHNLCKIQQIKGKINSEKKLEEGYYVFKSTCDDDNSLLYKGKPLEFNSYGQTFIFPPYNSRDFTLKDPDMKLTLHEEEDCHLLTSSYIAKRMRLRLHYDIGLGGALSYEGIDRDIAEKSTQSNFGLDLGYIFPSKSKFKVGAFLGVGIEKSKMRLSYDSPLYRYTTDQDVDGDIYIRNYRDLHLAQKASFSNLALPIYFDFAMNFNRYLAFYVDLGAKLNMNMSNSMGNTEGSATVDGLYQNKYGNLLLDEQWGFNGFGQHSYSDADLNNTTVSGINKFSADGLAGLGFRVNIPVVPLSVELGLNYSLGVTKFLSMDNNAINISNPATGQIVYNTISGLNSIEHVNNLSETLTSTKNNSLKFRLGLVYKF